MAAPTFAFADYVVLVGFLLLSASIGVYFAWADRRRQSNRTFLTANKQLGWFPVSLSMMASFLSSIAILGLPAEVFLHGSTLWINVLSAIVAISLAAFVFMPIYYKMDITSINQYLELRFKSAVVKDIASGIFILATLLYTGVVLYGPSLALGAVTGIPVSTSILLNGLVCTFYTTIGGIKAVVWTDVVQMVLIFVGYIMVIISGVYHIGGISKVWEVAEKGGRITFLNLSVSPYDTYTSWNMFSCWTVVWMAAYCAGQTQVQRYSSIGSLKDARKAVLLNVPGVSITLLLSVITGLVLFAVYSDCDPRLTGDIKKADQLMPYIVQDLLRDYPGLSGTLVASVFSGSLSTLSSGYNALAAVTWKDFIEPRVEFSEKKAVFVTRGIAAAYGLLSISIAFLSGTLPSIVQASNSLVGAMTGPLLAIFFLGVFFPFCKKKGVTAGALIGVALASWHAMGSIAYPRASYGLPTSTAGCVDFNQTLTSGSLETPPIPNGILMFYHISYVWTGCMGFLSALFVGIVVSLVFERSDKAQVDPEHICPLVRKLMDNYNPSKTSKKSENAHTNEHELKKLTAVDR
ncbi:sodium-coupled monocarboxylate transporter 2 [Ixodes scapularis]